MSRGQRSKKYVVFKENKVDGIQEIVGFVSEVNFDRATSVAILIHGNDGVGVLDFSLASSKQRLEAEVAQGMMGWGR